jgi:membrane protein implicated in regulation of membrane protease activity
MSWWLWLLLGLVLSALELAAFGGFYLIFFGVGAFFVGLFTALDLTGPPAAQWLIFTVASVVMLLVFRRPILRLIQPVRVEPEALVGEIASTMGAIQPGEIGRAELRGTVWSARNAHTVELARGARCRVERVDGLTLFLVPER